MNKRILIVEDEVLISEHLKRIVINLGHEALDICEDYNETMASLKKATPDLVFLDIRLNGIDDGIKIAKHLHILNIPFIYITSFSDKDTLKNAISQQPLGYVLKPFSKEDIQEQLQHIEKETTAKFITLGNSNKKERIAIQDILWLRSENVYLEIHCIDKIRVHRGKLKDVLNLLPPSLFVRTGQSHAVNIVKVNRTTINSIFIDNKELPLSKKYKKDFFKQFEKQ